MANPSELYTQKAVRLFYFLDGLPGPRKVAVLTASELGTVTALIAMGVPIIYTVGAMVVLNAAGGVAGYIVSLNKR